MTTPSVTTVEPAEAFRRAFRIAAIYLAVGLPYILLSDRLVDTLTNDPLTTAVQSAKGFAFVVVTAVLLFTLAHRALRETAEAGERMAEAQQLGQVGSWTFDLARRRLEWSAQQAHIHGCEAFDGRYETFLELVHEEDRDEVERAWRRAIEEGTELDLEHRVVVRGERRWVHLRGRLVRDERGEGLRLAGTSQDVTERRQADDEVSRATERLQALARHLTDLREDERQTLSRDVHDHLGQYVAALRVTLARLRRFELGERTAVVVEEMDGMVDELATEIRRIARALRPPVVDRRGLVPALRELVEETEARSELSVELSTEPESIALSPEHAVHVYRLCQEALNNVVRHAEAKQVWLRLHASAEELRLEVEDDGRGLVAPAAEGEGLGLLSMGERAQLLGGDLELATGGEAGGLRIRVRIPQRGGEGAP